MKAAALMQDIELPENILNSAITDFGRDILADAQSHRSSVLSRSFWSTICMHWAMRRPDIKLNMFRLVDVLPALHSNSSIAYHVSQYLGRLTTDTNWLLRWSLNIKPSSLKGIIAGALAQKIVRSMAAQFIAGESPDRALSALRRIRKAKQCFTVDLLGEFALSEKESSHYLHRYLEALEVLGREVPKWKESAPLITGHAGEQSPVSVSVKLSALYSQCNILNFERSVAILSERLARLAHKAKELNAGLYIDAENMASNQLIYAVFKQVFLAPEFIDFPLPGIVIQAYARQSEQILDDLLRLASKRSAPIAIRLVKGAYWDYETILSEQNNWPSPLWLRKESSDAHYEYLSRKLLDNCDLCLAAFGSHNIRSLSHACCYAESKGLSSKDFELQMLYGMADPIAAAFSRRGYLVRLYVPLGEMLPGMGYFVRRLLENTSNESFLRHTFFSQSDTDELLREPLMLE